MKKMLFLSLVFSVMALGTAVANDANSVAVAKPKCVHISLNVPPIGLFFGDDRLCPPPLTPKHSCKHCNKHDKRGDHHHGCCMPKPPKGKHDRPRANHDIKPHGKPGGAPVGRPGGNTNHAPGRK